jgi:L-alanine-DL-glutamate epimerase-like enolase superfamily enzyme
MFGMSPHCTARLLWIAGSLHVVSAIPLFLFHEFYPENPGFNKDGITRVEWKLHKHGYIGLPQEPGLGVEVDET